MNVLLAAELFAGYFFIAGLCCIFAVAAYDMWCDGDAERRIQVMIAMERAEDELALQAEEIRNLAECEPWERWA